MSHRVWSLLVLAVLAFIPTIGCGDDDATAKPTVTLTATDCPSASIVMTSSVAVTGRPTRWVVLVAVNVTCAGVAVAGAELSVEYPWLTAFKATTNGQGDIQVNRKSNQDSRPTGSIAVAIEGSDGSRTQTVDF